MPSPRKLVCGMTKVKDGLSPHSKACCMASAVVLIADISVSKLGKKKNKQMSMNWKCSLTFVWYEIDIDRWLVRPTVQ